MCSILDNEFPLRTEADIDEIPNCASCSRVLKRVESHWHCIICRRGKAEAKCPQNCKACIALYEDKWRFSALSKSEKENLKKKLFYSKLKIGEQPKITSEAKKPSPVIHIENISASDNKISIKSNKKHEFNDTMDLDACKESGSNKSLTKSNRPRAKTKVFCLESVKKNVKEDKVKGENRLEDSFMKRLKEFQTFLYEDLVINLPDDLVSDGFKMPEVPSRLILKFKVTKNELIRLLATASISFHLSNNIDQINNDGNLKILDVRPSHVDNEFIGVELFASLIKFKANSLAQVIFQIRESILSKVFCKDESIIPMMIRGPINPAVSFFGNLDALQKAVQHDKTNVLTLQNEATRLGPKSKKRKLQN